MENTYSNEHLKVLIYPSAKKSSNVGIYEDTGDLVYNKKEKDIPKGIPVNLFMINTKSTNISQGDVFVLREDYDDIWYCTNVDGDSVSGVKINFTEEGHDLENKVFEHHPMKNVQKVVGTSIQENFFKLWNLNEEYIINLIYEYNNNLIVNKYI